MSSCVQGTWEDAFLFPPKRSQYAMIKGGTMKLMSILTILLLAAAVTFACGGEKKEEPSMMEQAPMQVQQGGAASGFAWETLPSLPGAVSTRARMMPGNQEYAKFEVRIFQSRENARNIVNFYKEELPEEWTFAEETTLDNGLQGQWEAKTGRATLWVRVTKSETAEDNQMEIIWGKKK